MDAYQKLQLDAIELASSEEYMQRLVERLCVPREVLPDEVQYLLRTFAWYIRLYVVAKRKWEIRRRKYGFADRIDWQIARDDVKAVEAELVAWMGREWVKAQKRRIGGDLQGVVSRERLAV